MPDRRAALHWFALRAAPVLCCAARNENRNKKRMRRRHILITGAGALAATAAPAVAARAQGQAPSAASQAFAPAARPITLVSGYSPGGSTDIAARLLADRMAANLDPAARVVVENRPGASGVIAADWLRRQAPDGHTVMLAESGSHAIAPTALVGWNKYDPVADFTHLGVIGTPPLILVANNGFAAPTAAGTIAKLREAPRGSVTYATSGVGGVLHLSTEMLAQHLGTQFVHVPYRSGAQMLQAIHTGEAQFGIAALPSAHAMVRDGLARGVAVTGTERFPTYPDIATLAESGVPGFEFTVFYILVGPPGMAPATAAALNRALVASLREDPLRDRMLAAGHETWRAPNGPTDAQAFIGREIDRYREIVRRTGVRLQS
jgi:tripartite-type tricarboxylate transporter receptor subunit TctC